MRTVGLILTAMFITACSAVEVGLSDATSVSTEPQPPRTTEDVMTTTTPLVVRPLPEYETAACGRAPTVAFSVLCETVDNVLALHVDAPDPTALVAAARIGIATVEPAVGESGFDRFTCYIPDEAFVSLCDAIAERGREVEAPLSSFVTAAVESMFAYGLDPFSVYVPGDVINGSLDDSGLVYSLGMVVSPRQDDGAACSPVGGTCRLEVVSAFEFAAARSAGVATGDIITAIDAIDLEGLTGPEAVALLEGSPGTSVVLDLDRRGALLSRAVVREGFRFAPTEWDFFEGGIAYFRMNEFSQQAAIDLGVFLQSEEVAASSSLILDLRDNPGGLVLAAQAVASQFLDGGVVLVEQGRDSSEELPVVDGGLAIDRLRLVVLVNRASASASEIVAAVLQERGRATIVGEPTFGKNLVQWVTETRDGGQMRVTVARWETPDGLDIGIRGLTPDIEVVSDPATDVDDVLAAAIDLIR